MTKYIASERFAFERNQRKLIYQERYVICGKCKRPTIKVIANGYQEGHQKYPLGYFCKHCKTLFCSDFIQTVSSCLTPTQEGSSS